MPRPNRRNAPKVKAWVKLIVFALVALAFWLRYTQCNHPILNPGPDTGNVEQTETTG